MDPPAAIGDEYESGPELEDIVRPAAPGLIDYALRPKSQANLWEALFGPEEEDSLGRVQEYSGLYNSGTGHRLQC